MLRMLLHFLILPIMLWLEKRDESRFSPLVAAGLWYLLGVPFMVVEAWASGPLWSMVFRQTLVVTLFFLPPAYVAFRAARSARVIGGPLLLFLLLACLAVLAAAMTLARVPLLARAAL